MGHYGIIFNSNRELLRNYHAEKRFGMIFDLLSISIMFYRFLRQNSIIIRVLAALCPW